jgi:hypothetical protein
LYLGIGPSKNDKKRKKEEIEKERQGEFNKIQDDSYLPDNNETKAVQDLANDLASRDAERTAPKREEHKKEAMSDVTTPTQGLTPQQRQTMQESANKQLSGQLQNYSKMLSSSQGWRGVRGGKGQADVNRQALNAQTQIQRDLNLQDADLSMQRLAAYLSSLEGKEANELLRNQKYWDYVVGQQDKRRSMALNKFYNKYYGTV